MRQKFNAQKELIAGICGRLDMEHRELADLAGINRETMRKYANGYQKMGDTVGILLKHVERERLEEMSREADERRRANSGFAVYSLMESGTLESNFQELASRLGNPGRVDRKELLGNLRAMLEELEKRERKRGGRGGGRGVSSEPPSGAARLARRAAGE